MIFAESSAASSFFLTVTEKGKTLVRH